MFTTPLNFTNWTNPSLTFNDVQNCLPTSNIADIAKTKLSSLSKEELIRYEFMQSNLHKQLENKVLLEKAEEIMKLLDDKWKFIQTLQKTT